MTHEATTPSKDSATRSISPNSTLKPPTFTCESSRPKISSREEERPGLTRPKSPVRNKYSPLRGCLMN